MLEATYILIAKLDLEFNIDLQETCLEDHWNEDSLIFPKLKQ